MAALGAVICEAIVLHYGRDELLRRLAHPFWFQCFGAVMGMDWHSSGITTSVIGALRRGLAPIEHELGIYVCGGRGRQSRETPGQLQRVGERTGLDADALARTSRLVAKVDSAAVQDGYQLYLHGFIVTREGRWCVVQQGMNDASGTARRYHWLSEGLTSFVESPHAAVEGRTGGRIVNLADVRAARSRALSLELTQQGPTRTVEVLRRAAARGNAALDLFDDPVPATQDVPHLSLPAHHDVRAADIDLRRLHATLAAAAERGPADFEELLLLGGVGARTVAALAFVAEVLHGAPSRFSDPARFSLAHGGKDGHPFPVPLKVYDETLNVMRGAVARAKLGAADRVAAIERLDIEARRLERAAATGPSFERFIAEERAASPAYGGRTV
jgi:uncharacterized protein